MRFALLLILIPLASQGQTELVVETVDGEDVTITGDAIKEAYKKKGSRCYKEIQISEDDGTIRIDEPCYKSGKQEIPVHARNLKAVCTRYGATEHVAGVKIPFVQAYKEKKEKFAAAFDYRADLERLVEAPKENDSGVYYGPTIWVLDYIICR